MKKKNDRSWVRGRERHRDSQRHKPKLRQKLGQKQANAGKETGLKSEPDRAKANTKTSASAIVHTETEDRNEADTETERNQQIAAKSLGPKTIISTEEQLQRQDNR